MIPICIQTIENDDDRDFMEWLFLEYHPLMYATIRKVIHDQWTCEDVLQESVRKFIDHRRTQFLLSSHPLRLPTCEA